MIWLSIEALNSSFLETIVSFFYKKPNYLIKLKFENETIETYKLVLNIAKFGFIINPLVHNNLDYIINKKVENLLKNKIKGKCEKLIFIVKTYLICIKKI